jgi:hypothetical protein
MAHEATRLTAASSSIGCNTAGHVTHRSEFHSYFGRELRHLQKRESLSGWSFSA